MRGTVQDITERKKAEQAIRESQAFNESLLRTTPDIIYVYDLELKENVYSNDGNLKTLGYSKEDILAFEDKLVENLLHPDDYESYQAYIFPYYQKAKDGEIIEYVNRVKHKNGNWVWLHTKETVF